MPQRDDVLALALLGQRKGDATLQRNVEIERKIAKLEVRADSIESGLGRLHREIEGCYQMAEEQEQTLFGRTNCIGVVAEQRDLRSDFEDFKTETRARLAEISAAAAENTRNRQNTRTQIAVALIAALTAVAVPLTQFAITQIHTPHLEQRR